MALTAKTKTFLVHWIHFRNSCHFSVYCLYFLMISITESKSINKLTLCQFLEQDIKFTDLGDILKSSSI